MRPKIVDEIEEATRINDDPPPHREALHEESHAEGGHGGTEMGWLVSYADMMTLLFGLFVILFSITQDKSKSVEEVMKKVSDKFFRDAGPSPTAVKSPETKAPETPPPPPPTKALEDTITELRAAMEGQQAEFQKKIDEITVQAEKAQTEKQDIESQKLAVESQKKALERKLASVDEKKSTKAEPVKPDPVPKLQQEIESLKAEAMAQKAENDRLQKDIASSKHESQNYMLVLLSWESEKHDLDLQVVDPRQKSFNFKKRQVKGEPGQFELDSRYGPGIEMWKAENFVPGDYKAQISFYAQNGNEKPARAHLTVITNLKTYNSDSIEISKKGEARDIGFGVNKDGSVTFKGTGP